jgi:hypothetical protein
VARRLLRTTGLLLGVAAAAVVLLLAPISIYALVSPFDSVAVPASCAGPELAATTAARVHLDGIGDGIRVASDGRTEVVAVLGPGGTVTGGEAVVMHDGNLVGQLAVTSRTVDAAVADGIVYLFDDKIGFLLDAQTGVPIPRLFESDNYRGLFVDGGADRVQTSIEATAVGLGGRPFFTATVPMSAVVDACLLASGASSGR